MANFDINYFHVSFKWCGVIIFFKMLMSYNILREESITSCNLTHNRKMKVISPPFELFFLFDAYSLRFSGKK